MNKERLKDIVFEVTEELVQKGSSQRETIDAALPFLKQLGFDSLMSLMFVLQLENKLEVKLDIQSFDADFNIEQLLDYLNKQMKAR